MHVVSDAKQPLTRDQARAYIDADIISLIDKAWQVRKAYWGDRVWLCSIVNARNGNCTEDCAFCAQSSHYATDITPTVMLSEQEIIDGLHTIALPGVGHVSIVTSGRNAPQGEERTAILRAADYTSRHVQASVCASLGICDEEYIIALKQNGVTRIHHNIETSRRFFPSICTTHTYDERIATIRHALAHGMEVCAGGIFGMGETWEDRLDMAYELAALGVTSIPLNFLRPIAGTPLADMSPLTPTDALRCIALFRLIAPRAEIRICGGREYALRHMQALMYYAGATGVMTGNYLTTDGISVDTDKTLLCDTGMTLVSPPCIPTV